MSEGTTASKQKIKRSCCRQFIRHQVEALKILDGRMMIASFDPNAVIFGAQGKALVLENRRGH